MEMNHKELTALIKRISGQANFIGAPRIYVDIFDGDLVAAVWLNQVVYWDGINKEPIGFYKTYAEWKKELGLSEFQVRRVSKICEGMGLVNIMFKKVYGTPKNHYLVVWPKLLTVIKSTLEKPEPEETKGSENEGSEGEDSSGSKEGKESQGSLTENEITPKITPLALTEEEKARANRFVDGMLELSQSPGIKRMARIDSILSYLGGKLQINTETKRWKEFAKFVDDRQQAHNQRVDVFVSWLTSQKNFDIQFWPPSKMQEMWPQAFVNPATIEVKRSMPTFDSNGRVIANA
jgi:hypothetical protein